jgi:hypothetical protein
VSNDEDDETEDDDVEDDDEEDEEGGEDGEDREGYSWTRSIDETLNIILRRRNSHFVLDVENGAQDNVN